jgi:translation initiation factor 2 subunit 1
MLIRREGFPEVSDLLVCTVTNIQHNSVFVNIHEYGRQGMITISEIAPGRIRNIRDYVVEGRVVICKVLSVNRERGYIDLSLRRVSEGQKRQKNDEIKQELKAEKIVEITSRALGMGLQDLYTIVAGKFLKQYFYLYQVFDDVINDNIVLKDFFDKNIAESLEKTIREKIKPKEIAIAGDFTISIWEDNGAEIVRTIFSKADTVRSSEMSYLGGGRYRVFLKGTDYKVLEKSLKDISEYIISGVKKSKGEVEFERVKNLSEVASE